MSSSLIRGKFVICRITGRNDVHMIEDGAVFQRHGKIVEIGPHSELAAKYTPDEVIGSAEHVVLPGLVNAHHHVGLTPLQLGSLDQPLELWFATRIGARDVDPYLDTLYSAFEMVESGVTTVQHLHGWVRGGLDPSVHAANQVLRAYDDIGMRVSYSFAARDQNQVVYEADEAFLRRLPADLVPPMAAHFAEHAMPIEDHVALFEDLYGRYNFRERSRIQLAPANLHWCSDRALSLLRDCSERYDVPLHMHLMETAYQKEYARRRTGTTALQFLHRMGMLGPKMTIGHGVWLTEDDIDLAAETGIKICHNCSSNLRLRSGVAPLNHFENRGISVAIGLDEAGINDDRDMLQEMRMVLKLHREPGLDDLVPTAAQVIRMATEHGAQTTPFGSEIGTLEAGKAADMVVMKWCQIALPFMDEDIPVAEALIHRAKASGVDTVLVAGDPILRGGRFTRVDKQEVLDELALSLNVPLKKYEVRRRQLSKDLLSHFKDFWQDYLDKEVRDPFYRLNSRI